MKPEIEKALEILRQVAEYEPGGLAALALLREELERGDKADNKTLMRLAQDLGVDFSTAKIIFDKAWREAEATLARFKPLIEAAGKIGGTVAVEIWDWLHSESAICPPWVNTENSRAVRAVLAAIPEAEKREEEPGYPRIVLIDCPVCGFRQRAGVHFYFGDPLPSYGHECCQCGHEIGESEWNESAEKRGNK